MALNQILKLKTSDNPDGLLRLLVTTAIISIVIILLVSGFSFYRVFSGFVIRNAETDSIRLCNLLIDQHQDILFTSSADHGAVLAIPESEFLRFDRNLRHILAPYQILKVKIYDPDKKIIYSTEPALIGQVDAGNLRLAKALSGLVDAKLETKEEAHDLKAEHLLDVDVVETYVPILSPDHRVVGSFEIYMNVTPYRDQIRKGGAVATLFLTLVTLSVFAVSFLLIRRGTSQLKQAQAQLEILACTDMLTSLANRHFFFRRGEEEFTKVMRERSSGEQSPPALCCLLIDVDFFKTVNDTWGHWMGDQVLKEIAERLDSCVRPYDIIGRYGGEEFAVLLPDTHFEDGLVIAERIRERIQGGDFLVAGAVISLTASIGLACTSPTDDSLTDLLKRADEGLYLAKDQGRDRIAWV